MRSILALLALAACGAPTGLDLGEMPVAPYDPSGSTGPVAGAATDAPEAGAREVAEDFGVVDEVRVAVAAHAPDRILVGTFAEPPDRLVFGKVALELKDAFDGLDAGVYLLPDGLSAVDAVDLVEASGLVRYAELDYVRTASADTYRVYQWNLDAVKAETAWTKSTGAGIKVAVIDTGVRPGGADGLTSLLAGWDYVNDDADATDDNGHGTHVAGTIGQRTNNNVGVAGLAYNAAILPIKVLDASGSGYTSDTILGVQYAVQQGARVVNMSLGGGGFSQTEQDAMTQAYDAGVFLAAASGNATATAIDYPAAYANVVSVGATGFGGALAPYSNVGTGLDLVAPGGNLNVDGNGDGYADGVLQETFSGTTFNYYFYQGTSMATPHVAASAALLMAVGATNAQAESNLKASATDLGVAGYDTSYGYGLIQPAAAIDRFKAATNVAPVARPGGPYSGTAGTAVSLSGATSTDSDGTIASYAWSFGDGTTATGANASKTWSAAGTYTVTLTVTDDVGATSSASTTATIAAAPTPTCVFSGSISSGTKYHTFGTLAAGAKATRTLSWTTSTANLDFQLQAAAVGSTKWTTVASSASTTAGKAESISYTVATKYNGYQFRWGVVRKSGSTSYCIQ